MSEEQTEQNDADFITILSSDMIATIVEEYFNKKVYRQKVKVVDTKSTEAGYMFSLTFVPVQSKIVWDVPSHELVRMAQQEPMSNGRDNKGRFVKGANTKG